MHVPFAGQQQYAMNIKKNYYYKYLEEIYFAVAFYISIFANHSDQSC